MATVVSLQGWRDRMHLTAEVSSLGWRVQPCDVATVEDPLAFYVAEPLESQFTALGLFSFADLKRLVEEGTGQYASAEEIADRAAIATLELLDHQEEGDQERLRLALFANLLNFANTQTARIAVQSTERYRHLGAIFYRNPNRADGKGLTIRPMALSHTNRTIEPAEVALAVCQYMASDHNNHPEYFTGIELDDALKAMLTRHPEMLSYL